MVCRALCGAGKVAVPGWLCGGLAAPMCPTGTSHLSLHLLSSRVTTAPVLKHNELHDMHVTQPPLGSGSLHTQ